MTALLEQPSSPANASRTPAQGLREGMAAVRVSFTWLGTRKSLSADQRAEAAQPFDAEGQYLICGEKVARHEPSGLQDRSPSIKTKITLDLEVDEPTVPRARHAG